MAQTLAVEKQLVAAQAFLRSANDFAKLHCLELRTASQEGSINAKQAGKLVDHLW